MSLKQMLRSIKTVRNVHHRLARWRFDLLYAVSPLLASKYLYHKITGKRLDIRSPRDFNEKLQWLKLYWQNPLVAKCADKYEVHEYARDRGCEEILNQLFGVYNHPSEIDWDALPEKFALKCTHGCGFNIICDDKSRLDKNDALNKLNRWMKVRYDKFAAEIHYVKIRPRIICERYIETEAGFLPNDYKVYCFNGNPRLILVCRDRCNSLKLHFMDVNWNMMDIGTEKYSRGELPEKPDSFESMMQYAKILSEPFPFVRVDFYIYQGKPILGEMTFTPAGCMAMYYNAEGLLRLGNMLRLPSKYK